MNRQKSGSDRLTRFINLLAGQCWWVVAALLVLAWNCPVVLAACFSTPAGLVGWWPGDGNANNVLGTNNGTLQGGATADAPGMVGQAFSFDGTNGYVQVPNSTLLQPTNLTIECWVKFSALDSAGSSTAGDQYIVFKQNTRSTDFEGFDLSKMRQGGSDYFRFLIASASGQAALLRSATAISAGVWYHVAAVRGSNFTQLYVNGVLERQTNVTFVQNYGTQPLYFGTTGQPTWDHKLKGNLDEVSIYNRALSSNEIAAIYFAGAAGKCKGPEITVQPQNQSVPPGTNVNLSVSAVGFGLLNYQWQFNDGNLSGATGATLTLTNVQPVNAGEYIVIVSNTLGATTSQVATVTVDASPEISASPVSLKVLEGGIATFSVTATGTEPLFYQWQKGGVDLSDDTRVSGATNSTLNISPVQFGDAGGYHVVVSNPYGMATSTVATLTVATNLPPLSGSIGVWGDVDNDGLVDVLLAGTVQGVPGIPDGRFTRIYHNTGAGFFDSLDVALPQLDNASAAWGDFDNDGNLDLLLSGTADGTNGPVNVAGIYRNAGSNQFTQISAGLEALAQGSVAWVDADNDGLPDVFLSGLPTADTNWVSRLYHNNGNGTFTLAVTDLVTPPNVRSYWADYDNDGYADLLQAGSDTAYLLKNDGAGGFTNASVSLPSQHHVISPWGDFDGDGDFDFMTSSYVLPSLFFGPDYHPNFTRNDGNGALTGSFDYSLDMWLFSASWGDIDNSGRACVVVSGWVPLMPGGGVWGSATMIYINMGSSWQLVGTIGGWDNRSETWVDYDGDGDLDIFTTGAGLTTFWNNNVAFHRDFPQPPLNPTNTFTALDAVTLSWQSPANTPPTGRGLTYNVRVGHTPGGVDVVSPLADAVTGRRLVQTYGNAGAAHLFKLNNLPVGNYYWSVQSVGQSYTGSPFATEGVFVVTNSPPVIVSQPTNLTVLSDSNAVFATEVIGTKPLHFQWRKDGLPLSEGGAFSGCASPLLIIANAQPNLAGAYDLVITNKYGGITSAVATLVVHGEPRILTQPADRYALPTRNAEFVVGAAGAALLTYQWLFNGTPLVDDARFVGTATPVLTLQGVTSNDAGAFTVIITNSWGSITSAVANLSLAMFRYVNVNNPSPGSPHTSWATAATVIQDAISVAGTGDEIQVTNGVYAQGGLVGPYDAGNRVSLNKPVTVVSVNGPAVTTIIGYAAPLVSSSGQRCAYVSSGALLSGFTLTQGKVELTTSFWNKLGGGVWCDNGGVVSNCFIIGNRAGEDGGGIMYGKAVNCVIAGNYAKTYGGGSYLAEVVNSTIVGNSSSYGGGAGYCQITNSIVYNNQAGNGANSYNSALTYCCTTPLPGGSGNITNDPVFVNYAAANYRLQFGSPCIDAGQNAFVASPLDSDGHQRVVGASVDMGAFEHQPAPWIYASPTNQSAIVFSNASLVVGALGEAPLYYQWKKNGVNLTDESRLSGSGTPTLSISPVNVTDFGNYQVFVTNSLGSATSAIATLTILGPPLVSVEPASRTVPAGTNVTFSVTASGLSAISYQWRFNQAELSGKTNSSLALTNVQSANAGNYDVVLTNIYGVTTSAVATLTVVPAAPAITTQAVSRVASVGQTAFFTVAAKGSEPMTCQWQFNGVDLPVANAFTLALTNVNASFAGSYRAAVSNFAGFAYSTNVTLVVSPVLMWGLTNNPQLQLVASVSPLATNVIAIAAGASTDLGLPCMALRADGTIAPWGYSPRDPAPPTNAVDVVAIAIGSTGGSANNLVLRADGSVVNWTSSAKPPVPPVLTNQNIVAVAAGGAHQLALRDDGTVIVWGSNTSGQTNVPPSATNIIAIAAGTSHSLALRSDGTVVGWGLNTSGQASALSNAVKVVAISAGGNQSVALLADGTVVGRIVTNTPGAAVFYGPPVGNTANKIAIAAGSTHSLALGLDRTVNGWGATNFGALNPPAYATNLVTIAAGGNDSLALVPDPFAPPIPPRIGRPPIGRSLQAGENVVFNALAVGGLPLSFQWLCNGVLVEGRTNQWLAMTNVSPADAGDYQLVAANNFGAVTSAVAVVTVGIPQPALKSPARNGNTFSFTLNTVAGIYYASDFENDLPSATWTEFDHRIGVGTAELIVDTNALPQTKYYRVRAIYPPPP